MNRTSEGKLRRRLETLLRVWPDDPPSFLDRCGKVRDWPALLALAQGHGVLGALHRGLLDWGDLPAEHRIYVERQRSVQRLVSVPFYQSLEEALAALAKPSIPVAALKGPLLGERLFGDASTRPTSDLDLLIAPDDLPAASAALAKLGYEAESGSDAQFFRAHHHHVHLYCRKGERPVIELHFRLSSNFGVDLPAEEYLARSRPYQTRNGVPCRVLQPEDEFLYLAIHAAGHRFTRLAWLYDLKLLWAQHPDIDLERLTERAAQARVLAPFLLALDNLQSLLNRPLVLSARFSRRARLRRYVGRRLQAWEEGLSEGSLPARCASLGYQLTLCDRLADRLRLLRRRLAYLNVANG